MSIRSFCQHVAIFTGLIAVFLQMSCGTEGGNPHRQDPVPQNGTPANNEKDPDQGQTPNRPGSVRQDVDPPLNPCNLTLAIGTQPGFDLVWQGDADAESPEGRQIEATLAKKSSSAESDSWSEAKALDQWQPAPGDWRLTVTEAVSDTETKTLCQSDFLLDDTTTGTSSVELRVAEEP
jgi:hypothetical protein